MYWQTPSLKHASLTARFEMKKILHAMYHIEDGYWREKLCQNVTVCSPPPFPHGPLWLASGSHPTACLCLSSLSDLRYCTRLHLFGNLQFWCCIPISTPHSWTRLKCLKWCETNYKHTFFCFCLNEWGLVHHFNTPLTHPSRQCTGLLPVYNNPLQ